MNKCIKSLFAIVFIALMTSIPVSGQGSSVKPAEKLRIGLAQLKRCGYIPEGVRKIDSILSVCSREGVDIVCFPETYIPGLRGGGDDSLLPPPDQPAMEKAGSMQEGIIRRDIRKDNKIN